MSLERSPSAPTNAAEEDALREEARVLLTKKLYATAAVQPTQVAEILLLARWFRLRPDELQRTWSPGGVPKRKRLPVL